MASNFGSKGIATLVILTLAILSGCGSSSPKTNTPAFKQVAGLEQRQVTFQSVTYPFYVFAPSTARAGHLMPAVMLIHGGGGNGPGLIEVWKAFAENNGIILVAPTLPLGGSFETTVVPQLYPLIMDAARSEWAIDPHRIYVFGISAGGYTVFDACMFDSQYFAAGGVFAAVITPGYDWIVQQAKRKIGISIYLGDHDQFFTVAEADSTRNLLTSDGFPVRLTIFPNLGHNYGAVADAVNADVWNFFSQYSAP